MTPRRTVILGLDPGFARLGYALLRAEGAAVRLQTYGTFTTPAQEPPAGRYAQLATALTRLLRRTRPDRVAIEKLFFSTNVRTAMAVSEARGVLLLCCAQAGVPIVEFTPNEVKRSVTGSGTADKRGVQKMAQRILQLTEPIQDDDAADAVAIALTGLQVRIRQ
ncbi:MAG: crossover junction endodeoxyribonuclease RuvC [Candidatus Kerfeldbacteria bacterium]|nr:crossover junction endodeoxyribonuclease RuvC [Candidatus Kerfeldbacteria bacterium]